MHKINAILSTGTLPIWLQSVEVALDDFLEKVSVNDFQVHEDYSGQNTSYEIEVVPDDKLSFPILGTDFRFVLNPSFDGSNQTPLPIHLTIVKPMNGYLPNLKIESIGRNGIQLSKIFHEILQSTDEILILSCIKVFLTPPEISQFVSDVYSNTGIACPFDPSNTFNQNLSGVIDYIKNVANEDVLNVIGQTYLNGTIDEAFNKSEKFLNLLLYDEEQPAVTNRNPLELLMHLCLPKLHGYLFVSPALEISRKIFTPVRLDGTLETDENIKPTLIFSEFSLFFTSDQGFGSDGQVALSLPASHPFLEIGKSGFRIGFSGIKLDLSKQKNIKEAEHLPNDFIGAYIEEATITLPEKWFEQDNSTTLGIYGRNLLVGTGGITGTLGLGANATKVATLSDEIAIANGSIIKFIKTGSLVQIGDQVVDKETGKPVETGLYELDNSAGKIKINGGKLVIFLPSNPEILFTLGKKDGSNPRKGFAIGFQSFELEFQQNEITHSEVKGSLHLPAKFDNGGAQAGLSQTIEIEAHFEKDGDFSITASRAAGVPLRLPEVFTYTLTELEVGKDDGKVYLETSGALKFEGILGNFLKEALEIKEFRIYSDGSFEIRGGKIPLPDSVRLPLGPVEIYVTAIHLGAHEQMHNGVPRQYKYFGFDGGVSVDPGGVDASGDGIKFYFTVDDDASAGRSHHSFLKIESLSIDLIIPGTASKDSATLILQGYLSLKEKEYAGSVKFSLPKAKLAGGAGMKYNKEYPAFLVDAFVELSTGIPLGQTALGIFGFRGLFGLRYIASKAAGETWTDYYRKPVKGVNIQKMDTPGVTSGASNPFSIGAGISLATIADDGKTFSSQLFLLLSIPNLILLEGRANIMGKRIGLDSIEEPQFYAVIAYSPGDSVMLGFGADFFVPKDGDDKGKVLKLKASMEAAYFFKNSRAWYVNFGTKAKPVQAEIISLFDGYSYLMLSASGIEAGAGVHFGFEKKYLGGTLRAKAEAYFDVWGKISFERPKQIGGGIGVGGYVDVSIFGFGFYISLDCILTVEAPKPFRVAGSVELCIVVKLLVKKVQKCFTVEFVWEKNSDIELTAISALGGGPGGTIDPKPVQGFHLGSGKMYPVHYFGITAPTAGVIVNVVPLDTPVEVLFEKALLPDSGLSSRIGGFTNPAENYIEVIPPTKGDRQVSHERILHDFSMEIWDGVNWQPYHPYKALTDDQTEQTAMANFKSVYWQKTGNEYNKLRFPAQSPFSYTEAGQPGWYIPEEMGLTASTLWCAGKEKVKTCVTDFGNALTFQTGTAYSKTGLTWTPLLKEATAAGALVLNSPGTVEFLFPIPVDTFEIRLQTNAIGVFIHYYQELRDSVTHIRTGFQLIASVWRDRNSFNLNTPFIVSGSTPYIAKIVVEPAHGDEPLMSQLLEEMDVLQNQIYTTPDITPQQVKELEHQILVKQGQWQIEKSRGCNIPLDTTGTQAYQEALEDQIDACEALQNEIDGLVLELCSKPCDCCCCCGDHQHNTGPVPGSDPVQPGGSTTQPALPKLVAPLPPGPPPSADPRNCCDATLALAKARRNCYAIALQLAQIGPVKEKEQLSQVLKSQLEQCKAELARLEKLADGLCATKCSCCHEEPSAPGSSSTTIPAPDLSKVTNCCQALEASAQNLQHCAELQQQLHDLQQVLASNTPRPRRPVNACLTRITSVCWLTWQDANYNANIPAQNAIDEDYQLMVDALQKSFMPIWRPNSTFRMAVTISDKVNNVDTPWETHHFGFKTGGPLGFYNDNDIKPKLIPANQNPSNDYPRQKPTEDVPENQLKFYVDFDRSYPNADGRLLYAKPLYYKNPVFNIFYKQQYAHHFFTRWADVGNSQEKYAFETFIQDPVQTFTGTQASAIKVSTETVPASDYFGVNSQETDLLNAMTFNTDNCIQDGAALIKPPKKHLEITTKWLEPLKLYTAIFYNRDMVSQLRAEVHRYCFQTSRYANLEAQINSYHRTDKDGNTKDAVFALEVPLSTNQIYDIWSVLNGQSLAGVNTLLDEQYPDDFDRVWLGIMEMEPIVPAVGTDFTFINTLDINNLGHKTALLIRSDEPLNDPKIPLVTLRSLEAVVINSDGQKDTSCQFIVSRDGAQIFVMSSSGEFLANEMTVTFRYLLWNSHEYAVQDTIKTLNLNIL